MKKTFIILIIMISLFISGCSKKEETTNNDNNNNVTEESSNLKEIYFEELQEKINNKESFILVVAQTTCSHCAEYRPIISSVLDEYDIVAYEIESDKLTTEQKGLMNDIANISGTPTTIFIEDGIEKTTTNRIVGPANKSKLISRFKAMGYIKE